jgi:radical SAM superfamily enzyme YgiQ (UPF0313 family)
MKVLLVSPNREDLNMRAWPLGLASVAASTLRAGHEVKILDFMDEKSPSEVLKQLLQEFQPEVIAPSIRNIDDQQMEDTQFLLDLVRQVTAECRLYSDAPIVLGGAGYSLFPNACLSFLKADMGIQGEGEVVFPELLDRLTRGEDLSGLSGLYIRGRGLQGKRTYAKDLNRLPLPDIRLMYPSVGKDEDFWVPVQTRRGCPMSCSYCSTPTIEGRIYRSRAPETVVPWLAEWFDAGFRQFFFVDNIFNVPASYAIDLCNRISAASLDITWRNIVYPDRADEDLIKAMAKAGCFEVSLGFESGDEQILHVLNKRFKLDDIRNWAKLLADYGIRRMGFLMLGGPGETKSTVEQSIAFVDSLNLDMVKITFGIRIYPYTELARIAVEEGKIEPDDDLLVPRFYMTEGLEDWLHERIDEAMAERPNWIR